MLHSKMRLEVQKVEPGLDLLQGVNMNDSKDNFSNYSRLR